LLTIIGNVKVNFQAKLKTSKCTCVSRRRSRTHHCQKRFVSVKLCL